MSYTFSQVWLRSLLPLSLFRVGAVEMLHLNKAQVLGLWRVMSNEGFQESRMVVSNREGLRKGRLVVTLSSDLTPDRDFEIWESGDYHQIDGPKKVPLSEVEDAEGSEELDK